MIDKVSIVRLLGVKVTCGDITTYHLISLFKKTKKQKNENKNKKNLARLSKSSDTFKLSNPFLLAKT